MSPSVVDEDPRNTHHEPEREGTPSSSTSHEPLSILVPIAPHHIQIPAQHKKETTRDPDEPSAPLREERTATRHPETPIPEPTPNPAGDDIGLNLISVVEPFTPAEHESPVPTKDSSPIPESAPTIVGSGGENSIPQDAQVPSLIEEPPQIDQPGRDAEKSPSGVSRDEESAKAGATADRVDEHNVCDAMSDTEGHTEELREEDKAIRCANISAKIVKLD